MNPIAGLNVITFFLYIAALVLLIKSILRKHVLVGPGFFASAALITCFFVCVSNFLEHSGISDILDDYEGFAKDLFVMFLLIFLYVDSMHKEQTKREKDQKRIQDELREKAFLLTEIHHRVNNNLQIVSGLLSMQGSGRGTENISEALRIAQNRIQSIAKIHQMIYDSSNLLQICADSILKSVIQNLEVTYKTDSSKISVKAEMDKDIKLDPDRAMPLGLILNELVTNALKHAFFEGEAGEVSVRLEQDDKNIILSVSDSGKGLAEPAVLQENVGIGMKLVESLVLQIRGNVRVDSKQGTSIRIIIPKEGKQGLIFSLP
ncbi:sensor histidine kinase [Leptospira sarikeiensis]|uniref:histidine kinase n=1 Tax=Leptospira sarikeiensis TaxID=2484943 RepID=A0A4R9KBA7_9LEPT|nr:sensor histidine kinase [Leptospira sarikeiensis]TGL64007.1 sensor histidine kinase [Leptospira sarikeiensis]